MYFTRIVRCLLIVGFSASVVAAGANRAAADILYVANSAGGSIGAYQTDGTTINAHLITGLQTPDNIAISGTDLYVTNYGGASVGKYTTAGAPLNTQLITGVTSATGIVVDGSQLFVGQDQGQIGEYNTSGGTVNSSLIFTNASPKSISLSGGDLFVSAYGSNAPYGPLQEYGTDGTPVSINLVPGIGGFQADYLAVYNGNIYVSNYFAGTISEFTVGGSIVNLNFISGLSFPTGIVVSDGNLFIATQENDTGGPGKIGEYSLSGAPINPNLITGLPGPAGLAIIPTPEPSTLLLAVLGGLALLCWRRR